MRSPFTPNSTITLGMPTGESVDENGLPVRTIEQVTIEAYLKQEGAPIANERELVYRVSGYAVSPSKLPIALRGTVGKVKFDSLVGSIVLRQPLPSIADSFTGDRIQGEISIPL